MNDPDRRIPVRPAPVKRADQIPSSNPKNLACFPSNFLGSDIINGVASPLPGMTIKLHGHNLVGESTSNCGGAAFRSRNPITGDEFGPLFYEASPEEIDKALHLAADAFPAYQALSPHQRAIFLETIAGEIDALGDQLIETAQAETGYPGTRCESERSRATMQAHQFASLLREGSWVDARIDLPNPARKPLPKPDVRSLMRPIGPVVVFGASNFPIAISVVGADTISALAAGCPVVVKAHPAHPATCELAARAILSAATKCGIPPGTFSMVHGRSHDVGINLVRHSKAKAAAFTGSLKGGRALLYVASSRPEPIPFYAEMGSVNPVFILPEALAHFRNEIAEAYIQSLNMGVGQFCTNPGLVLGIDGPELSAFIATAAEKVAATPPATMVHQGIHSSFVEGVNGIREMEGLSLVRRSSVDPSPVGSEAACFLFETTSSALARNPGLLNEVFGPVSTIIRCSNRSDLIEAVKDLAGSLTASIHGTPDDLLDYRDLIHELENKVGRLIFNGFPTGIEVCSSMHHGGPYPATTHSHFTSIGTRCIYRFVRPICYQGWPDASLPRELQNRNSANIWRLIDNRLTRDDCQRLSEQ